MFICAFFKIKQMLIISYWDGETHESNQRSPKAYQAHW